MDRAGSKSRTLAFELSAQRHTRVPISMRSRIGLNGLEQPHGHVLSVSPLEPRHSPQRPLQRLLSGQNHFSASQKVRKRAAPALARLPGKALNAAAA